MPIVLSNTRNYFPLSRKKIWKKTIVAMLGWLFLMFLLSILPVIFIIGSIVNPTQNLPVVSSASGVLLIVFPVLFIITFVLTFWYQTAYFNNYYYDLTQSFIVIKKGVFTPREITIPYERVQDVYVDQDIFDRMFGLYDVHLSSATVSSGMEAHIDGVEKVAADGLKEVLLKTVNEKIHQNMASSSVNPHIQNGPK